MPQKGVLLFLFRFSTLGWEKCGNRHFWTYFGTNGKQQNSAVEESSNGTSQDGVLSHLAGKALTTTSLLTTRRRLTFNPRAQHQAGHMTPSQESTRGRRGPIRNPRFLNLLLSNGVAAYKATSSRPVTL